MMLGPGSQAPDVQLPDQYGNLFWLSSLRGEKCAVVYFYPKDETLVCTREACGFRDQFEEFKALGAEIIGISRDNPASHRAFMEHHHLPFRLLSDPADEAFRAFGLKRVLGLRQRATFVIGPDGVVRAAISHRLDAGKHVREALEALRARGISPEGPDT